MWFQKKDNKEKEDISLKRYLNLDFQVTELYRTIKQLEQRINNIEIDMRYLQNKFKDKIFKKEEKQEESETNKKLPVFLNPYGNPI